MVAHWWVVPVVVVFLPAVFCTLSCIGCCLRKFSAKKGKQDMNVGRLTAANSGHTTLPPYSSTQTPKAQSARPSRAAMEDEVVDVAEPEVSMINETGKRNDSQVSQNEPPPPQNDPDTHVYT